MADEPLIWEQRGRVAVIRLNRPHVLNAFDEEMLALHAELLHRCAESSDVSVLVYTGEGRAFSVGIDLKAAPGFLWEPAEVRASKWVTPRSVRLGKPSIAAIHGIAVGGGFELALGCDMRIAARGAKIGLPEVRLGAIPGGGGTQLLPRLVNRGDALRLLLTGDSIEAEEALRYGLVQQVVPEDGALDAALAVAERIAAHSPIALASIMEAVDTGMSLPVQDALRLEQTYFERNRTRGREDLEEGIRAFQEKRPPRFPSLTA